MAERAITQIHSSRQRVLDPRLAHPKVIALLTRSSSPERLKSAGQARVRALLKKHAPRLAEKVIRRLADQLTQLGTRRAEMETEILTEVVGKDFTTASHLASYARNAPVTRRSGTSIR